MGLTNSDFVRLRAAAACCGTKNHGQYLAEALQCLRATGDPVEVLALLRAMWGSSHAARTEQKIALNDVGKWLESELRGAPGQTADDLALQLGWLRRLAIVADAERRSTESRESPGQARRPMRDLKREFGDSLERLRSRRREAASAAVPNVARPAAPPPTELPSSFAVRFLDFMATREQRKSAKDRAKRGKPPKDTFLGLVPTDETLVPISANLCCSILQTTGIEELFLVIEQNNNAPIPFFVAGVAAQGDKLLAQNILLVPPIAEPSATRG